MNSNDYLEGANRFLGGFSEPKKKEDTKDKDKDKKEDDKEEDTKDDDKE